MDQLIDPEARERARRQDARRRQEIARAATGRARRLAAHDGLLDALGGQHREPDPEPPYWGVKEIDVDMDEVYRHLDTHVLFKLHWGGRGVKGEEWKRLLRDDFQPRLERMWREQTYLHPRALLGYFPCNSDGNELIVWDPDAPGERELERLVFPRQPKHDRICLADFYRPLETGTPDVVAIQAVTAGDEVTELMASLEAEGEFAEQLFVHGIGVQTAEGMAEWLHGESPRRSRDRPGRGSAVLVGLPGVPRAVRAREGLPAARRALDRSAAVRRLRAGARAVDARDRRSPPPGRLLRDEVRLPAQGRQAGGRRADRGHRQGSDSTRPAHRRRPV